jgi:hypothetical protein
MSSRALADREIEGDALLATYAKRGQHVHDRPSVGSVPSA